MSEQIEITKEVEVTFSIDSMKCSGCGKDLEYQVHIQKTYYDLDIEVNPCDCGSEE